ncbi:MAG: polysaccharide pyruvyl transferase family protein [Pseudomonadota bacterium]
MILIAHAFSRRNEGDGLLVDLTMETLRQAGIHTDEFCVLALDAASFADLPNVVQAPGEWAARVTPRLFKAGVEVGLDLLSSMLEPRLALGTVASVARKARGIVAVGGGYLVTDSINRQLGVLVNHLIQLRIASRIQAPTVYLPQSVGPLGGPIGAWVRAKLRGVDRIYVRDAESETELRSSNSRRCPDLAVLKLSRTFSDIKLKETDPSSTVLVLRDLPNANGYTSRLIRLIENVSDPVFAVQADVEGPRGDRAFYGRLRIPSAGSFSELRKNGPPRVVVSVRLHGAISALMAGFPAVHLAYERKGWGAYADLGLEDYVHDARNFSPDAVAKQVREIQADPTGFWRRVENACAALREKHDELVSDLRGRLAN